MSQQLGPPTLAEDLLLLLFQPESGWPGTGTSAGENALFHVLAGAVLADLGLGRHVRTIPGSGGSTRVEAVADRPPPDEILRSAWDYVSARPHGVQAVLAAIGPALRLPLLERLVERGDLSRASRELHSGTGRRARLLSGVREVLVDAVEPHPRVAALAALISGSGTLPRFDPEIPWTSAVSTRAKTLEQGNWGAEAAAEAVARTVTATIVSNVIVAAAVLPRR